MEFDFDALQELVAQEEQAVGVCEWTCGVSCRVTGYCPATCGTTGE
ncbi:ALQxL family class IV lanthipeptide [Kitasatospora azatica]|nr:ALQxL family class IV lanthipeptide [Kitasatospora azatica]